MTDKIGQVHCARVAFYGEVAEIGSFEIGKYTQ